MRLRLLRRLASKSPRPITAADLRELLPWRDPSEVTYRPHDVEPDGAVYAFSPEIDEAVRELLRAA